MTEPSIDQVVEALLADISGEKQNAPYEVRVDILRMIISSWREQREALKPFANIICLIDDKDESKGYAFDCYRDDQVVFGVGKDRIITAGSLRRAFAALNKVG